MRTHHLVLFGALLAGTLGQAAPTALLPVKLAYSEDAIRSSTNLVPLQMHPPPPLEITTQAREEKDTRTWIRRTPNSYSSTPIPIPMEGDSDPDEKRSRLLDPDREEKLEGENSRNPAQNSTPKLEQKWGWLAGTVTHMEAADQTETSQRQQSPWDEILDERDEEDEDYENLDVGYASKSPFDVFRSQGKSEDRGTAYDAESRDIWSPPGQAESTRVESDYGLSGLGNAEDER